MKKFLTSITLCAIMTSATIPAFASETAKADDSYLQTVSLDDNIQIAFSQESLTEIQNGNGGTVSVTYVDEDGKTQTVPISLTTAEKMSVSVDKDTEGSSEDTAAMVTVTYTDENGAIKTVQAQDLQTVEMTALEAAQNISLEKK